MTSAQVAHIRETLDQIRVLAQDAVNKNRPLQWGDLELIVNSIGTIRIILTEQQSEINNLKRGNQ